MSDKIFGEKDDDPVEVYPMWDDEYFKKVRIDKGYLKGIILQPGGKLKGNYYIITPETCALLADTIMKNSVGDEVHFKLLEFPYKIVEDVSRNFQNLPSNFGREIAQILEKEKYYCSPNGRIDGCGRKCLPSAKKARTFLATQ